MLTEFSLQTLVDISKSRLSSFLSNVVVGLERPSLKWSTLSAQLAANPQNALRSKANRLRQEYADHISLLDSSQDVELLAEAFSNLVNLKTIGIRDFNSPSRHRDYPDIEWKSK